MTALEKQERVDEVSNMLLSGYKTNEIVRTLSKRYKTTGKCIYNYIREAKKLIKFQITEIDVDTIFSRYEFIYLEHIKAKRFKDAQMVLDSIMRFKVGEKVTTNSLVEAISINIKRNNDSIDESAKNDSND